MRRSISVKNRNYLLGLILLAVLWQAFSMVVGEQTMIFPGPLTTLKHVFILLGRSYTYRCIAITLFKMIRGFLTALVLALLFGTVAGNDETFSEIFEPLIITLRSIPTASLVYLFIVLAGFRDAPMYLVVLVSFPIMYEGVKGGIMNIDENIIDAARLDGGSFLQTNRYIKLPLAIPYIIVSLASSFSLSFKIEIMAEVITGAANAGLGSAILGVRASDPTNMVPVFAYSFIAVAIMLMIDWLAGFIKNILLD